MGISAVSLVILSPLLFIIAVIIKITSPGPILYPWVVIGRDGKRFTGYKFRTMVVNADELKKEIWYYNERNGPTFKMKNDPRVTPHRPHLA
jgi:lipopolysaccharide/colanic/teichoic acid biosynthesis glycosyltransferase